MLSEKDASRSTIMRPPVVHTAVEEEDDDEDAEGVLPLVLPLKATVEVVLVAA